MRHLLNTSCASGAERALYLPGSSQLHGVGTVPSVQMRKLRLRGAQRGQITCHQSLEELAQSPALRSLSPRFSGEAAPWMFFLSPARLGSPGALLRAPSLTQGSKSTFTRLLDSGLWQGQKSDHTKAW